jgi:hypothetical protein
VGPPIAKRPLNERHRPGDACFEIDIDWAVGVRLEPLSLAADRVSIDRICDGADVPASRTSIDQENLTGGT